MLAKRGKNKKERREKGNPLEICKNKNCKEKATEKEEAQRNKKERKKNVIKKKEEEEQKRE